MNENFGASKLAERYGVKGYPAVFVDDVLMAAAIELHAGILQRLQPGHLLHQLDNAVRSRHARAMKAGVDVDLMIKAIANGSGGSTQFGIRAPWMAQRRFLPAQGTVPQLQHYFDMIGDLADTVGAERP